MNGDGTAFAALAIALAAFVLATVALVVALMARSRAKTATTLLKELEAHQRATANTPARNVMTRSEPQVNPSGNYVVLNPTPMEVVVSLPNADGTGFGFAVSAGFEASVPPVVSAPLPLGLRWTADEVLQDFGALVGQPSLDTRDAFARKFDAEGADLSHLLPESAEQLWWVPLPESDREGLLLPGWKVIRDWAKSYQGPSGAQARAVLEPIYAFADGPSLRIVEPARGKLEDSGRISLLAKGLLSGA